MKSLITTHQLNQLLLNIEKTYQTFGTQKKDDKIVFDELKNPSDLVLGQKKPVIIFRNILFGKLLDPQGTTDAKKIALIGINNCDTWSLLYLLEEFQGTEILPKREDILIISSECLPTENCFCGMMGKNKMADFDLHIQEEKNHFAIFSGTKKGEDLLKKNGIKESSQKLIIKEIQPNSEPISEKKLFRAVDNKEKFSDYWQKISQNCFGCGGCSAVCPLCFCTRQEFKNDVSGENKQCLKWDTCFAKGFSEIQHHYDFRPRNVDRLYNWYHHKFVRSFSKNKHFLCTGCGRCIEACPANLNMKNIMEIIIRKDNE